jgi:DMSO/TMAO reductase YedYZ molybdopterin-dependent catalytic subunit
MDVDIHCVTTWSKLDTEWRGVTIDALFAAAGLSEPPAPFAMIHCDGGYTTNLPVEDLVDGKAMIATHFDGEPLSPEHGGPARLLVPTSTSGRAPSGRGGCGSWTMTSRGSGKPTGTTCTATLAGAALHR